MQAGMIGLGRMGLNMARRLMAGGHQVVAYNRSRAKTDQLAQEGAQAAYSLAELVKKLSPPRVAWIMLPAGAVDGHLEQLAGLLEAGDVVVEGGNSNYKDDPARAQLLAAGGIHYLDAGVSGGIWGLREGYCLMLGGPRPAYYLVEPLLSSLAPPGGHIHCGPSGAGHFVKMIHNAIEYGMMQAYAEGFELLEAGPYAKGLDYARLARVWNRGSVIRSWLLELLEEAFSQDPRLESLKGYVEDSGEGRWSLQQALETATPAPVLALSLMQRFRSRQEDAFADRLLAALRNRFGGHPVKSSKEDQ